MQTVVGEETDKQEDEQEREFPEQVVEENKDASAELPEAKEKKKLLVALLECDKQIQKFETCLLNLHNGEVLLYKIIFNLP